MQGLYLKLKLLNHPRTCLKLPYKLPIRSYIVMDTISIQRDSLVHTESRGLYQMEVIFLQLLSYNRDIFQKNCTMKQFHPLWVNIICLLLYQGLFHFSSKVTL